MSRQLEQIQTALNAALMADLKHEVDWMDEQRKQDFSDKYPNISQVIYNIMEMKDE